MRWWVFLLPAMVSAVSTAAEPGVHRPGSLIEIGAAALRSADLAAARSAFESELTADSRNAAAHLGLARVFQLCSERQAALRHFAAAFELAPTNPIVVREYSAAAEGALELALLHRLIRLTETPARWKQEAEERIAFRTKLRGRAMNQLVSSSAKYQIRMPVAHGPDGRGIGWVVRVSINGSSPLRLLLDTGSRGVLISRDAAARLSLEPLSRTFQGGFGDDAQVSGEFLLARSLRLQELEFSNAVVESTGKRLPGELDGLIGLDLFRHFEIVLDGPAKLLRLTPIAHAAHESRLLQPGHLLVARGEGIGGELLNIVLDSGAAYSLLQTREPALSVRTVSLEGLSGSLSASLLARPMRVRLAGFDGLLQDALSADLTSISESFGMRIDGFAGFPYLRSVVTRLNLLEGGITIQGPSRR